ncbi:hypothetical protein [Micromonospora sp. LOL_021]|uniref:hypothetical protein n=1 Tax=Micromonospora sp. LOL_021 TaxID=3345417 RepID=UPI003A89C20F
MNRHKWFRQTHRWLSVAFTASMIIVTVTVLTQEEPAELVYLSPLLPLTLLLLTGLYLFALPYSRRRSSGSGTSSKE